MSFFLGFPCGNCWSGRRNCLKSMKITIKWKHIRKTFYTFWITFLTFSQDLIETLLWDHPFNVLYENSIKYVLFVFLKSEYMHIIEFNLKDSILVYFVKVCSFWKLYITFNFIQCNMVSNFSQNIFM